MTVNTLDTDSREVFATFFNLKKCLRKLNLKIHLRSTKVSMLKSIKEFCKNSTLHGLSYLANKDLCLFERAFFAVSFVTVVIIAGFFINNVYNKWCTTPVLFCINPQPTHIKNEPFPALTICNMNQAYKANVIKLEKNSDAYAITQMLCKHDVNSTVAHGIKDWSFLQSFITNISQSCEKMLLDCRYGNVKYNCSHLFHPIITDEGLCCSFNMVHPKFMYKLGASFFKEQYSINHGGLDTAVPWTAEAGYPSDLPERFYPLKAAGIGESLGLDVILDAEVDEYYCSTSSSFGFKMVLHSPTDMACVKEVGIPLSAGYEAKARVRIEKLHSDTTLHRVHVKHRQCLFQDEGELNYFASYSQHNCMMECVADWLMRQCGCVAHFMPRRFGNETICSIYDTSCMKHLLLYLIRSDDNDHSHDDVIDQTCDEVCLPSCSDLKYYAEFFTTPISYQGFVKKILRNRSSDYIKRNIALLTVYYKESSYRSNIQTEFIGMTDVLSSVGGLIGLFFGFSFISLAEIIFYTFIRPCRKSLTRLNPKRARHLCNTRATIPKSSSKLFEHNYRTKMKTLKNLSVFKVSPTIDSENIVMSDYYGPKLVFNKKLVKDFPKVMHPTWRYD